MVNEFPAEHPSLHHLGGWASPGQFLPWGVNGSSRERLGRPFNRKPARIRFVTRIFIFFISRLIIDI